MCRSRVRDVFEPDRRGTDPCRCGPSSVCQPLRRLPRHRREWRRAGSGIASRVPTANRSGADDAASGQGLPAAGMPAFATLSESGHGAISFASCARLKPRNGPAPVRAMVTLAGGGTLDGSGPQPEHGRHADARRRPQAPPAAKERHGSTACVTSQADWPSYNGQASGSRYSPLAQITKSNVAPLAPKWIFTLPNTSRAAGDAGRGRTA